MTQAIVQGSSVFYLVSDSATLNGHTVTDGGNTFIISDMATPALVPSASVNVHPDAAPTMCAYQGGIVTDPGYAQALTNAVSARIGYLYSAYQTAIQQPVSYTSKGGITKLFQADAQSQNNLMAMLAVYSPIGSTPAGFYWVSQDNTQVPFTLADLQGLAQAMGGQGWAAFAHLQAQKASVNAATTVSAVNMVTW